MPCDAATTCGIEIVDSTIIIADGTPRSETERIIARKKRRHLQSEILSKTGNRYKMASRPMDVATNSSASCSSSSSSSSSTSSSCYDRPRQNDSTNSSSSLILILERPETNEEISNYGKIVGMNKTRSSNEENEEGFDDSDKSESLGRVGSSGGFSGKVTSSSIENLAKKKATTPTTRCRRKRSTASPRTNSNSSIIIEDKTSKYKNTSFEAKTLAHQQHETSGFVATSTLTKNSDCNALLMSKNASRSAAKLKLQSSCGDSTMSSRNYENNAERYFDKSRRESKNVDSHGTLKSQQSTISVAAIRATNVAMESRQRRNNDDATRIGRNLTSVPRYGSAFASAPSLNNNNNNNHNDNHKNQNARTNREFSSHSTSTRSSNVLPLAVVSTRPLSSSPSQSMNTSVISKNNKKPSESVKTSGMQVQSTVKSSPSYVLSSSRDLSRGLTTVAFANSLKSSSSFTAPKAMRKNRNSRVITSLHASLGQLPITTSSCATSATTTTVGEAASLENLKDFATPHENNEDTTFVPITLYSTNSSPGETKNCSIQARNSLERISHANGGSTSSSSFTKIPLRIVALPEVGNSPNNVANAFRNNLVSTGYNNNNNINNNNNNNNANPRCNHLVGTCACSATTTTSQTSSTLTRTSNLANGIATSSSWTNNSVEQETDYVVDPVQGNAYHKGQFLGKGGFARVYLMTDVTNGNQYACKIIPKNRMQKIHIQKIAREIMIHKELNHVNVVQMHHYFEDNINVYMLLEPCPRKSLMHVLKYRGKVTEPEARYYMRQMVTGVAYIHSQKVVHRDLKPGNMFLSDGMIVKIGDFGLATRPDGQRRRVTICGTPNYIAPEVLYKQAYSYEADVWALGCILYALLAGQPPFDTSTLKETYARICNNRYKKLDDSVVSRSGQDLIGWLLQPIPELRPSLERVKEHAYLTMEYVPSKLSHTCCYRIPVTNSLMSEQTSSMGQQQIGTCVNSAISRGIISNENIDRKSDLPVANLLTKNQHQTSNVTASQMNLDPSKNVALTKKPKVGNWLFRKLPKLPRFRQRLTKLLCPEHKKPDSLMMHRAIESCLSEIRCTRAQHNPILVDRITPLFVTKWIDYSNKYGLGFQLSDRSVGVLFNDSTKMSYTHDRRRVEYATTEDEVTRYRNENDVPSSMEEKLELLRHFTHYMDNFLTNGGEVREQRTTKFSRTNSSSVPRMRRWLRTDKAIVMELTVPLLQVNFFVDHSKIVVSEGTRGRGYLVTYIDASRQASSYWLNDLRDIGCTTDLYERLSYVSKVIAELENDAIFETATNFLQNRPKTLKT